ncbi:MAG: hypothetical protein AB7P40_13695 [Chloroflexota bacterium]
MRPRSPRTSATDERNEYHGISVERAQRILDALDGEVCVSRRLRTEVAEKMASAR